MSMPNEEHWKALGRLVGYLKTQEEWKLILRSPEELRGVHICDANYAQCEESRRSVTGGIDTLGGTILGWQSKKQPIVSLSSCESELISYTERAQNARFIQQLLAELIGTEPTAVIFEDNAGCIYLIRNQKTGSRTKHIAVRYLYGRELFQNGHAVPYFVRSEDNVSDGLTKNQPEKLFSVHHEILMNGHLPFCREDVRAAIKSMEASGTDGSEYGIPIKSSTNDMKQFMTENMSDMNDMNQSTTEINPDSNQSNPRITKSKSISAQQPGQVLVLSTQQPGGELVRKDEVNVLVQVVHDGPCQCKDKHYFNLSQARRACSEACVPKWRTRVAEVVLYFNLQRNHRATNSTCVPKWRMSKPSHDWYKACKSHSTITNSHTTVDERTGINKSPDAKQPSEKLDKTSSLRNGRQLGHGLGHGSNWYRIQDPFVRSCEASLICGGHGSRSWIKLAVDPRLELRCCEDSQSLNEHRLLRTKDQ